MKREQGLYIDEKIGLIFSYILVIALMTGCLYLCFTRLWILYVFASINVLAIGFMMILMVREIFKVYKTKTLE